MLARIAFRNTIKNWRHSLSALLSLSASFVSLVLFDGYISDVKTMYIDNYRNRQMLGDVLVENPGIHSKEGISEPWTYWVTGEDQDYIKKILTEKAPQLENIVRTLNFTGIITNGQQSQIFLGRAYDLKEGEKMRGPNWSWNVTQGTPLDRHENTNVLALGKGLALKLNCEWKENKSVLTFYGGYEPVDKPFDCYTKDLQLTTTTVDGQLNAVDLTAVALVDAGYKDVDDRYIQAGLESAQQLLNTDKISFLAFSLTNSQGVSSAVNNLNMQFMADGKNLVAVQWQNHPIGEMYRKTMDFLSIFRNFVIIVILVVSTLSVVNTMIKIVKERAREIGTMRSFGFFKSQIVQLFLMESIYLCLIGSVIGIVISLLLTFLLNASQITYKAGLLSEAVLFKISVVPISYLSALILLVIVGTISTFIATRQIIRSKIIENLTYV